MSSPLHVVYDGGCGFCMRSIRPFRALDVFHRLEFVDGRQEDAVKRRFPALAGADFTESMYVHVDGEPVYEGFFGFRRMLWASPWTWPLLPLAYMPFMRSIGPRVYRVVARNRHRLGCESEVCEIPSPRPRRDSISGGSKVPPSI